MLALCQLQLQEAGCANVETRLGSSNDLDSGFGRFKLVLIGRAFHWMDRAATLLRLNAMVAANGAVILFSDTHPKLPANAWIADFDEIVDRYAAADTSRHIRKSSDWTSHEAVLLASPFCQLERVSVIEERAMSGEVLVDRVLSRSSTTAARLGAQAAAMTAALRQRFPPELALTEVVELEALLAKRQV